MTDKRKDCPMRHENGNCTVAGGFCTSVNDAICEALHNALDCGHRSALRQQERSEPLTLDELRQMDGEPVWISGGGFWALVNAHTFGDVTLIENSGEIVKAEGWMKHMGAIYRHKPEKTV